MTALKRLFDKPTQTLCCMHTSYLINVPYNLPLRGTGRVLCRPFCRNKLLKRELDAFRVEWELSTPMGSRRGSMLAKWNRLRVGFFKLLPTFLKRLKNKTKLDKAIWWSPWEGCKNSLSLVPQPFFLYNCIYRTLEISNHTLILCFLKLLVDQKGELAPLRHVYKIHCRTHAHHQSPSKTHLKGSLKVTLWIVFNLFWQPSSAFKVSMRFERPLNKC